MSSNGIGARLACIGLALVGLAVAGGCGRQVVVLDEAGNPLRDAEVACEYSAHGVGQSYRTDELGRAVIPPVAFQSIQSIYVSKEGYQAQWRRRDLSANTAEGALVVSLRRGCDFAGCEEACADGDCFNDCLPGQAECDLDPAEPATRRLSAAAIRDRVHAAQSEVGRAEVAAAPVHVAGPAEAPRTAAVAPPRDPVPQTTDASQAAPASTAPVVYAPAGFAPPRAAPAPRSTPAPGETAPRDAAPTGESAEESVEDGPGESETAETGPASIPVATAKAKALDSASTQPMGASPLASIFLPAAAPAHATRATSATQPVNALALSDLEPIRAAMPRITPASTPHLRSNPIPTD